MTESDLSDLKTRIAGTETALSLGGVAVVGAGLSISSRFPATRGLTSLLWDALDSDLPARKCLANMLGREDAEAKVLVGDAWAEVQQAWAAVASSSIARDRFQSQFTELDEQRSSQPSVAHESLARLIHAGVIEGVVSLNWDTALEGAYERLYGTSVPAGVLLKPHGNAARPGDVWTFPHEPGVVSPDVSMMINKFRESHARILLVVGYSESDEAIVEGLVRPLDQSWRTIRIGPHATGAGDLNTTAEVALPLLAEKYAFQEECSAWHTVNFRGTRGVESWLTGQRLGPQDVDSCPELDEVNTVTRSLQYHHAVVLSGPTGSGKSICAYHSLRRLMNDGFEILRLRDNARQSGVRSWLTELASFPHRKVLFIDDAQDLSTDAVREIAEAATPNRLVLIVGIDHVAGGVRTVHLSARSAVTRLAYFVREQRSTLFPHIRALDDHVGEYPRDFHFEQRIEIAERQPTTWEFTYILTGGWRRVRREALELRHQDRADLALAVVAVAQVAGVDAGVDQGELDVFLPVLQRDRQWLQRGLEELRSRRLIAESEGRVRCAHLQAAFNVITWNVHPPQSFYRPHVRPEVRPIISAASSPKSTTHAIIEGGGVSQTNSPELPRLDIEADRRIIGALIGAALVSASTPLRGCAWLVGRSMDNDVRQILQYEGVLSDSLYDDLARRALAVPGNGDFTEAAQLLSEIMTYSRGTVIETIREHRARLKEWYEAIAPENGWALGALVNSLYWADSTLAAQVARFTDGPRLGTLILDGGTPHIYSSSYALDRLCTIGGESLRDAVKPHLDETAYKRMLDDNSLELRQISTFIDNLTAVDHDLSLRLVEHAAPKIASLLMVDPVRRWNDLFRLVFRTLGFTAITFGRRENLPVVCRPAARALFCELNTDAVARTLSGPQDQWDQMNFDVFIGLLEKVDSMKFSAVAECLDFSGLGKSLAKPEGRPSRSGLDLCVQLFEQKPDEVWGILDRLEPSLIELDPRIALIAPDVATRALRRGLPLDLGLDHQQWGLAAGVVSRLAEHNSEVALEVAIANEEGMVGGLISNSSTPFENLSSWIEICDRLDPNLIDSLLAELPEGAVSKWDQAIRRPPRGLQWQRDQIAPLVFRAAKACGHVRSEAEALLRQFPALARLQS